jgi:hypothetical protein
MGASSLLIMIAESLGRRAGVVFEEWSAEFAPRALQLERFWIKFVIYR